MNPTRLSALERDLSRVIRAQEALARYLRSLGCGALSPELRRVLQALEGK